MHCKLPQQTQINKFENKLKIKFKNFSKTSQWLLKIAQFYAH